MSTSFLGLHNTSNSLLSLRSLLPVLTATFYTLGISVALYNYTDPAAGAKAFGVVLPDTQPTPTEAAYTKIHAVRNLSSAAIGLGMITYLQFSKTCSALSTGPFAAAAMRQILGFTMLISSVVSLTDGYILQQFSHAQGLSDSAVNTAKTKRRGHAAVSVPIALLGVGWIYA